VESLASSLPLKSVTLFGSQASGRATAFSDVDVLVVYAGTARGDAYALVRRSFEIRGLEAHVYSEDEASALGAVIERMVRGGIEVYRRSADAGPV
jgi:predicted nucleotidyltransferase